MSVFELCDKRVMLPRKRRAGWLRLCGRAMIAFVFLAAAASGVALAWQQQPAAESGSVGMLVRVDSGALNAPSQLDPPVPDAATQPSPSVQNAPEPRRHLSDLQRGRWWLKEAARLRRLGQVEVALRAFDTAAELLPESPTPYLRAARLLIDLREPERLLHYTARAEQRAPVHPIPHLYRGVAFQMLGQPEQAARAYTEFARREELHPRRWEAEYVAEKLWPKARAEQ